MPKRTVIIRFIFVSNIVNYHSLKVAAEVIKAGGVVSYPTEHCFGLGCDPRNTQAIQRILDIKRRKKHKGLILIADQLWRFNHYIRSIPIAHRQEVIDSWPGPFTWLIPARGNVSRWLRGRHNSIAIRVTKHPEARALARMCAMPLVSTSANRATKPVLVTHQEVSRVFKGEIDYVVEGRVGYASAPSTIRNSINGQVIRGA